MLLGHSCVYLSIHEARGPRAQVWRERKWFSWFTLSATCILYMLKGSGSLMICLNIVAHSCVLFSLRGQYCFTVCVKSFGPLTRNYYVRAFLHAAWVLHSSLSFFRLHSCYSQSVFPQWTHTWLIVFCPYISFLSFLDSVYLQVFCLLLSSGVCAWALPASSTLQ